VCRRGRMFSTLLFLMIGILSMRWSTYWIVTSAVVVVGLAMGVTLPLVSLRLHQWGYDAFAIGVMAAMPAIGILLGARLAGLRALHADDAGKRSGVRRAAGGVEQLLVVAGVAAGAGRQPDHYLHSR